MAPVIVIPPGNRSVVAGSSEITLECIANARYVAGTALGIRIHSNCDEMDLQWKDTSRMCLLFWQRWSCLCSGATRTTRMGR